MRVVTSLSETMIRRVTGLAVVRIRSSREAVTIRSSRDGVLILPVERPLPISSDGAEPDGLFRLGAIRVPVIAYLPLGGPDMDPARCSVDCASVARGLEEGLDKKIIRLAIRRGALAGVSLCPGSRIGIHTPR